jgi:hypothetical protein
LADLSFFFFAKKFCRRSRNDLAQQANESRLGKYSGSWLTDPRDRVSTFFPPSPSTESKIGTKGSRIQLQQRNCFRFSRNSFLPPANYDSQRTARSLGTRGAAGKFFAAEIAAGGTSLLIRGAAARTLSG